MSNKIKQEMNKVEIPKELHERSKMGVSKAKSEMKKPKKWSFIIGPVIAALLALGVFVPNYFSNNPPENPIVKTINTNYAIDISNLRQVVGFSNNVFVGKVKKQVGTKSLSGYPETQFKVQVIDNIKGELNGTVVVNQQGGYDGQYLFLMEDDELLKDGGTYLFSTRYLKEENWNTVVPVSGTVMINNEEEKKVLIKKYTKAHENEVPF